MEDGGRGIGVSVCSVRKTQPAIAGFEGGGRGMQTSPEGWRRQEVTPIAARNAALLVS